MIKKFYPFSLFLILFNTGCISVISLEDLQKQTILDVELKLADVFEQDRNPDCLLPEKEYRFNIYLHCDNGKTYKFNDKELIIISSLNQTLNADMEGENLIIRTNDDYFNLAMEDVYLFDIRFLMQGKTEWFMMRWKPDWDHIVPPDYSGKDGLDGGDNGDGEVDFIDFLSMLSPAEVGYDGEAGKDGSGVVLNIAFYDDGKVPPFLIMYDVNNEKTYCFRKWPIVIDAGGGDGGDGQDNEVSSDPDDEVFAGGPDDGYAEGGEGGDAGNGGHVTIHYPESLDIGQVVVVKVDPGSPGDGGEGEGGFMAGDGRDGTKGTVLFVPVSDIGKRDLFPVRDPRFDSGSLRGSIPAP